MKLSEMRQILREDQIQLTKSLGQNFLHAENQIRRIIASAEVAPGDRILEIGPGLGPLTEQLLESGATVLAIEKDRRLFNYLQHRFPGHPQLTLRHADALDFIRHPPGDWSRWKLVSNLPYSVASPILVELAHAPHPPALMVATLQLEVAQRLIASPAAPTYGILSLLIQAAFATAGCFKIPASCFFPPPKVDSACVKLTRRAPLPLRPEQLALFSRIVKRSFSQRRKMMLKLLKLEWPSQSLEQAFSTLNIPPTARAENVSLNQFLELAKLLPS